MTTIRFLVNGAARTLHVGDPDIALLYALRNELGSVRLLHQWHVIMQAAGLLARRSVRAKAR